MQLTVVWVVQPSANCIGLPGDESGTLLVSCKSTTTYIFFLALL